MLGRMAEPNADGRIQRGLRNRGAIVEALIELCREGSLSPTAEQVAERAGVGTRTVFRHFDDMEGLHAEVAERVQAEFEPLLNAPAPQGSLRERAAALVERRCQAYERFGAFERSTRLHLHRSPFLQGQRAKWLRRMRADALACLPELDRRGETTIEAIELLTSFEAWDRLRSDQRLGRERARAVLEHAVLAVLAELG